jgi:hypothetical protein
MAANAEALLQGPSVLPLGLQSPRVLGATRVTARRWTWARRAAVSCFRWVESQIHLPQMVDGCCFHLLETANRKMVVDVVSCFKQNKRPHFLKRRQVENVSYRACFIFQRLFT